MKLSLNLKSILFFILVVFILNLTGWFFFGRHDTILLAGSQLKDHSVHYTAQLDSISIYINPRGDELPWYYQLYSDYDSLGKESLISVVETEYDVVDEVEEMAIASYKNKYFDFFIISGFPLYAKVNTTILAGPDSTVYEGIYIYFFGWHKIISTSTGIS